MLKIQPPKYKCPEGISLQGPAKGVLPESFVMMILGGPGSGKSHLISQLVNRQDLYGGKFDRIFYFGPTKYDEIEQDQENTCSTVTEEQVEDVLQLMRAQQLENYNALFVFDDVIGELFANRNKPWFSKLIFNRRHLIPKGTVSIIYTSQKFTSTPTTLRTATTAAFVPRISHTQQAAFAKEMNITMTPLMFKTLINHLPVYSFIFCNLQTGQVYNDKFVRI